MKITAVSDLHGHYPELEGGDLLIVAGDLTAHDKTHEYILFNNWLKDQKYSKKIVVAGNHDNLCQTGAFDITKKFVVPLYKEICNYLCDSGTEFQYFEEKFPEEDTGFLPSGKRTLKIWGSPWTLSFPGMNPKCRAFVVDTEEELAEKWALIPDDVDILITHSPPLYIGDWVRTSNGISFVGSPSLAIELENRLLNTKLHCYGHVHEGYGERKAPPSWRNQEIKLVNASHVNERYEPVNPIIRIEL